MYCLYALQWCRIILGHRANAIAYEHEEGVRFRMADFKVANALEGAFLGNDFVGECYGTSKQVSFNKFIKQRRRLEQI